MFATIQTGIAPKMNRKPSTENTFRPQAALSRKARIS